MPDLLPEDARDFILNLIDELRFNREQILDSILDTLRHPPLEPTTLQKFAVAAVREKFKKLPVREQNCLIAKFAVAGIDLVDALDKISE